MPWADENDVSILQDRAASFDTKEAVTPDTLDYLKADAEKNNLMVNMVDKVGNWATRGFEPKIGYDPFEDMHGYEEYAHELRDAESPDEMAYIKNKIDTEKKNAEVIASGNGWQALAGAAMDLASNPLNAIPISGALWKTYRTGGRILEGAARTAAYGAAVTTGQEAFLQAAQETRTTGESVENVAAATLLSGLLGGAVGSIAPKELAALTERLDKDMTLPPDPFHPDNVFTSGDGTVRNALVAPPNVTQTETFRTKTLSDGTKVKVPMLVGKGQVGTPVKKPWDIVDFIMSKGGILSTDANIGDIKHFDLKAMNKGYNKGTLISRYGQKLDDLREAAEEAGYLSPDSTVTDVLNAIDNTVRGEHVFSAHDGEEVTKYKDALSSNRGNDVLDGEAYHVYELLKSKGVTDVSPDEMRQIAHDHLMGGSDNLEDDVVTFLERKGLNEETLTAAQEVEEHARKLGVELNQAQLMEAGRLKKEVPTYTNDDAIADVVAMREAYGESTVGAAQVKKLTPEDTEIRDLKRVKAAYKKLPSWLQNPAMDLAVSISNKTREFGNKLADHSLALNMHSRGESFGASVETKIKAYQILKAEYMMESAQAWKEYRQRISVLKKQGALPDAEKLGSYKDGSMRFNEFFAEASKASRRGDTHAIPEVQKVAQSARKNVFSPIFKKAQDAGFFKDMDEASVSTAESWLLRKPNIPKILAERGKFKEVVLADLLEKEAHKTETRQALKPLVDTYQKLTKELRGLERKIDRRTDTADNLDARREEASLMNEYAYKRSADLSEPIDQLRSEIQSIGKQIETELDQIKELTDSIKEEKANFPALVEFERQYQKISRALSDITSHTELIDVVDAAEEIEAGFDGLMAKFDEALDLTKGNIKGIRSAPELAGLKELEKQRGKLTKKIAPFRKKLKELRDAKADLEKTRKPLARGGAHFEGKARNRVNTLSDQLSGKEHAIEDLGIQVDKKQKALADTEKEIRQLIQDYEGKTSKTAKGAMEREASTNAARGDKPALNTANKEVMNAAKKLSKSLSKERAEVDELAEQIIDRYTNQTGGRLPYEANTGGIHTNEAKGQRGSEKHRVWDIEDYKIEPWLENDLNKLVDSYTRTMAPDVELMKTFGTLDTDVLKKEVQDDYNKLRFRKESGDKSLAKVDLEKAMKQDMENLQASVEKLRGQFAQPDDYGAAKHVFERAALAWNFTRLLGDMVTSSIPDMARHVMVHGMQRTFNDSFVSMIKDYKGYQMLKAEAHELGTALDMTTSMTSLKRSHMDDFTPITGKIDAFSSKASHIVGMATGMNIWNSAQKTFAGIMTQNRMMKSIIKLGGGDKLPAKELEYLARHGIDNRMAKRIAAQFEKHGEVREVVNVPNAKLWDDADARDAFRGAVRHQVDEIIVTPGLDRPLWMSKAGWRTIGQFKSFTFSSAQRVTMSAIQQADAAALNGTLLMTFLGSNVYFAKSWLAGRPISDDPAVWIAEGVDRSGVTGWFFDVNNIIEKVTGGRIGVNALRGGPQMSRYASRNAVGALLGPSYGLAQDLFNISGSAFSDEWDEKDTHTARKILPLQNIPYMRLIFDQLEHSFNEQVGIPDSGKTKSYGTE